MGDRRLAREHPAEQPPGVGTAVGAVVGTPVGVVVGTLVLVLVRANTYHVTVDNLTHTDHAPDVHGDGLTRGPGRRA